MLYAAPASAREIDNRPIFYAMLKALESGFEAYLQSLPGIHAARAQVIDAAARTSLKAIADQQDRLRGERDSSLGALMARQEALNQRVEALNSKMRRLRVRLQDAGKATAKANALAQRETAHAAALVQVQTSQASYRSFGDAARRAQARLRDTLREIQAGQRNDMRKQKTQQAAFAQQVESAQVELDTEAQTFATERQSYTDWLARQNARIDGLAKSQSQLKAAYEDARRNHGQVFATLTANIAAYNENAQALNNGSVAASQRDAAMQMLAKLETGIDTGKAELAAARELVERLASELASAGKSARLESEQLSAQAQARAAALKQRRRVLAEHQAATKARVELDSARLARSASQLKDDLAGQVQRVRADADRAMDALANHYGPRHENVYAWVQTFLATGDAGTLLDAGNGVIQSGSGNALATLEKALRSAVENEDALRMELRELARMYREDTALKGAVQALEGERVAIENEGAKLEELDRALVSKMNAHSARLADDASAVRATHKAQAQALKTVFEFRQSMAVAQLTPLQNSLLEASGLDRRREYSGPAWASLTRQLELAATALKLPMDDPLRGHLGLLTALEDGVKTHTDGPSQPWVRYAYQQITDVEPVEGPRKVALAAAWFGRLSASDGFDKITSALADTQIAITAGVQRYSEALFLLGVDAGMKLSAHRLGAGGQAINVEILNQVFWLGGSGELEKLPAL